MLVGMLDLASKNSRAQIFGPVETDRAKKLLLGGIPTNPVAAIFLSKLLVVQNFREKPQKWFSVFN